MAVFRVEKSKNYTVMANYHLNDKNLTLKAKGLLSVMLSLPETWDYTLKGLAHISKEGVDAIREAIRELEKAGYILRSRTRNEKGQLKNTEYVIYEQPQHRQAEQAPGLGSPALEKPILENPTLDIPTLGNPAQEKPTLENPTQLNIYRSNTNLKKEEKNKSLTGSNPYPSNPHPTANAEGQPFHLIEQLRSIVRNHIGYDALIEQYDRERLDEIVSLMVEVLCSKSPSYTISGEVYPTEFVKERFLALNSLHIEYIFGNMKDCPADIRNPKAYWLACLFNAAATMNNHYDARVRHDFGL